MLAQRSTKTHNLYNLDKITMLPLPKITYIFVIVGSPLVDNNLAPRSILPEVAASATVRTVTFRNFLKFMEFSHDRRVIHVVVPQIGRIDRIPRSFQQKLILHFTVSMYSISPNAIYDIFEMNGRGSSTRKFTTVDISFTEPVERGLFIFL